MTMPAIAQPEMPPVGAGAGFGSRVVVGVGDGVDAAATVAPDVPAQDLQRRAERTRQKRPVWESRAAMSAAYRYRAAFRDWHYEPFHAFVSGGARILPDGRAALKCHPQTEAAFYEIRDRFPIAKYRQGLPGDWLLLLADYPGCQQQPTPASAASDSWYPAPP